MNWLQPLLNEVQTSIANASVPGMAYEVPNDSALILQTFVADAVPGAAQNVTELFLEVVNPTLAGQFIIGQDRTAAAVGVTKTIQGFGLGLMIPGRALIRVRANFNAGAAVNSVRHDLGGLLIPIGNILRV